MPASVVSSHADSYILPYPDGLHFTEDGLLQGIPLDIVWQEVGELVWHTGGQDVALQRGGAPCWLRPKQARDVQLQEVQHEVAGPPLLQVALSHWLHEF